MVKFLVALAIILGVCWLARRRRPALSLDEARALLGVAPDATRADVAAAHRRLIARVHPDAGGSAALAQRVNAARDLLMTQP